MVSREFLEKKHKQKCLRRKGRKNTVEISINIVLREENMHLGIDLSCESKTRIIITHTKRIRTIAEHR